MGDTYNISGQVGAVGPSSKATRNTFQQIHQDGSPSAQTVQEEIDLLRKFLATQQLPEDEHAQISEALDEAEIICRTESSEKVVNPLKGVATWVVASSEKILIGLISKMLQNQLDL